MDIAYIYSFGMFVKVVGYQTDRVLVPVAGMKRNTRRPRTWLPTFTTLRGYWVMFSRACGVVEGDGHEQNSSHLPCDGYQKLLAHPAIVNWITSLYQVTSCRVWC